MSADPAVVYGADRIGTRFNVVDAEHPNGHHGLDFRLPAGGGSEVVAYTECTVVECGVEVTKGFTAILGWYVVARTPLGRYLGWAHLRRGTRPALGTVLKPGDRVGLAASGPRPYQYQSPEVAAYDYPGTAWAGAHIHTTNGSTITSIFSGVGLIDPLPGIRSALTATASGGKLTPITQEEDDVALLKDEREALFHLRDAADQIRDYLGANGGSNTALDKTIGHRIDLIAAGVAALPAAIDGVDEAVWRTQVSRLTADGKVAGVSALQELADAKTSVLALLASGGVDVDKIAAAIAAKLPTQAAQVDVAGVVRAELARVFVAAK